MKRETARATIIGLMTVGLIMGAVTPVVATEILNDTTNGILIEALKSENIGWRVSAAQLLGDRKETGAVDALIEMATTDTEFQSRMAAIVALYKIADSRAILPLMRISTDDENKTVRRVALAVYQELAVKNAELLTAVDR